MTHPLFRLIAKLNNFRRLYPALQTGVQSNLWSNAYGPGLFAYTRHLGAQEVLVVLNTASIDVTLPGCPVNYTAGTALANLLDRRETITVVDGSKTPAITLPATSAKIFIAQSQLLPLDPAIARISPAHDSQDIAPMSPIVIQFSEPMDTASVEAAFSTSPSVRGAFSWSPPRQEMTFTPLDPGFPPHAMIQARIDETARDSTSGKHLSGAFESRFRTRGQSP